MKDLLILLSSRYCTSDHDTAALYTSAIDTMETFYLIIGFSCSVFWLILLFCCLGPCLIWCRIAGNGDIDLEAATPGTSIVLPQGYIGGKHLMRERARTNLFWMMKEMLGHRLHNSTSSATCCILKYCIMIKMYYHVISRCIYQVFDLPHFIVHKLKVLFA